MMKKSKPTIYFVLGLLALLASAMVLTTTQKYGAGISTDSVGFISTARNLAAGGGFVNYNGSPFMEQPPLYPAVLAGVSMLFKSDPASIAGGLNAALFFVTLLMLGILGHSLFTEQPWMALLAAWGTVLSIPLFFIHKMAWSEPLFIFLLSSFLLSLHFYWKTNRLFWFVLVTLATALLPVTRYVGAIYIPAALLLIIIFDRWRSQFHLARYLLFGLFASLLLVCWAMRNYAINGLFLGFRPSSVATLGQVLQATFTTLAEWVLPPALAHQPLFAGLVGGGFIALSLAGLIYLWKKKPILFQRAFPVHFLGGIYLISMIASSLVTAYDEIDHRLLSPLFLFGLLAVLTLVSSLVGNKLSRWKVGFGIAIFILWSLYPLSVIRGQVRYCMREGAGGYQKRVWKESDTIRGIQEEGEALFSTHSATVYSNAPDAIYILTDLVCEISPGKFHYHSSEENLNFQDLKATWPADSVSWLVWLERKSKPYLYTSEELGRVVKMEPLHSYEDGAVYRLIKE